MVTASKRFTTNNLDLLRLLFALTVCLVHACHLSGEAALQWIPTFFSSELAVEGFFVISGFLIFKSYEGSSSLRSYFEKRLRRIYPAYIIVILCSALLLVAVSRFAPTSYFSYPWLKYLTANALFLNFLQPGLPGVFEGNSLSAVNGALWTIKIEVMFYCSVPVIVFLLRKYGQLKILLMLYLLSLAYTSILTSMAEQHNAEIYQILARQLPGQLSFFLSGALLYYYFEYFERYIAFFVLGGLAYLLLSAYGVPVDYIKPMGLAILICSAGFFCHLGNFARYGDFSYGLYIIHFPIIQTLTAMEVFRSSPITGILITLLLSFAGAILLWHLVEKRFLLRNNHYRKSTAGSTS